MIRFCNDSDRQSVLNLFDECFAVPEDAKFNAWFFNNVFNINTTLAFECEGKITSMLQMIDCEVANEENTYSATYIYAACTEQSYRRKHQMSMLIEKAFEIDKQNGKHFSVLIPQDEMLFNFYAQYGYEKGFYLNVLQKNTFNKCKNTLKPLYATFNDIPSLNRIYEYNLSDKFYIKRNEDFWKTQIALANHVGHGVAILKNELNICAYAFLYGSKEQLSVEEIFADSEQSFEHMLNTLSTTYNCNNITYKIFDNMAQNKPFGAIKFYNKKLDNFYGYMNLMYN